jgi:hypothetical protein
MGALTSPETPLGLSVSPNFGDKHNYILMLAQLMARMNK